MLLFVKEQIVFCLNTPGWWVSSRRSCNPLCVQCKKKKTVCIAPQRISIVFPQSIFCFVCLFSCFLLLFLLNVFWPIVSVWFHFPLLMETFLLPPFLSFLLALPLVIFPSSVSLFLLFLLLLLCPCLSFPSPQPPQTPWWLRVNSWRCCSIASVCPACRANPTPHQALGPSTPTKYFYLFVHPRPSGASWR